MYAWVYQVDGSLYLFQLKFCMYLLALMYSERQSDCLALDFIALAVFHEETSIDVQSSSLCNFLEPPVIPLILSYVQVLYWENKDRHKELAKYDNYDASVW
jgi:hypothetical protein